MRGPFPIPGDPPVMLGRSPGMRYNLDVNKNRYVGLRLSGWWKLRGQGVGEGRAVREGFLEEGSQAG